LGYNSHKIHSLDYVFYDYAFQEGIMFIGRNDELRELNKHYNSNKFECIIVWGRRRVGKTELINKFCEGKKHILFTGVEANDETNFVNFSSTVSKVLLNTEIMFENWQKAFDFIAQKSIDERIVLVMDEYPYIAGANKSISSILQKYIDYEFKKSKLFIILCGSSMSFMENQVLGYESPLYGRRTAQFKIDPFDFFDSRKFMLNYDILDQALAYGVVGGTPQYLNQLSANMSVTDNIIDKILNPNAYLFEEPSNLIKQELREPAVYNSIIQAIALGNTRMSNISAAVNITTSTCNTYLKSLIQLGIIKKEEPVDKKLKKKSIYLLNDNLFRFWYRYVLRNMSGIQGKLGEQIYEKKISEDLSVYMGGIFEQICKEYLNRKNRMLDLPFVFTEIGSWWGSNPLTKEQDEIDIIARDDESIIIGECKWQNKTVGTDVLEKLKLRSDIFSAKNKYLYIFSKTGFTKELLDMSENNHLIRLVGFDNMCSDL